MLFKRNFISIIRKDFLNKIFRINLSVTDNWFYLQCPNRFIFRLSLCRLFRYEGTDSNSSSNVPLVSVLYLGLPIAQSNITFGNKPFSLCGTIWLGLIWRKVVRFHFLPLCKTIFRPYEYDYSCLKVHSISYVLRNEQYPVHILFIPVKFS